MRNGTANKKAGFWHFCTTPAPGICPSEGKQATRLRGERSYPAAGMLQEDPFLSSFSFGGQSIQDEALPAERQRHSKIHALSTDRPPPIVPKPRSGRLRARGWQLDYACQTAARSRTDNRERAWPVKVTLVPRWIDQLA